MLELDDNALLKEYVEHGSDEAFAALVARHVNKVYSIALRHTRNPHQAEEITQAVFVILARKSRQLGKKVILAGWLCRTARLSAVTFVRGELRRTRREQEAHMQNLLNESQAEVWPQIAPLLDAAMGGLSEADHDAVALRFFDRKSMKEIGAALGASEDAAKMRVNRALEKLRTFFTRRGIVCSTAALAAAISENSVQAAPAALAKTATAVAIAKGATASISTLTLVKGALKIMAWTQIKTPIVVSAVVLILVGTTIGVRKTRADEKTDDSWRSASLKWQQLRQAEPQVKILPTKFQPPVHQMWTLDTIRWGGVNVSVTEILRAAYRCGPSRVSFPAGEPQEKYDFISTLPLLTEEALQLELKKVLRLTGRWENVVTNILVLEVRTPDAPGLKPAVNAPHDFGNLTQGHIHCFGDTLSWKPRMPPRGLTKHLERIFEMPIVDETGLPGSYNLDLRWNVETDPKANQEAVKQALIKQLGLELVPARKSVEMLVVEKLQ
ncbi:MAG: polymerase, sigma-24 subunit, subfamily [Verrucomicrobiales bacterium]|nr:polymerase, sigma-24 subunit, subfamily [Verrucomicrobiales bacterium]